MLRRLLCNPRRSIEPIYAACISLILRRIGLNELLLSAQRSLFARITDLFPALRALRRRQTAEFAVLVPTQGTFGAPLLTCIELRLSRRLCIGAQLGLCLRV